MSSINKTNTGNPEWYTPDTVLKAVKKTMFLIDCDPASSYAAQQKVNAAKFYTKQDDGLDKDWKGRVWLNPPYHSSSKTRGKGIDAFASKLLQELANGNTKEAIFLAQAKTETRWFQDLASRADSVMFSRRRIKFVDAKGKEGGSPGYGSVFFYFGDNINLFECSFKRIAYTL